MSDLEIKPYVPPEWKTISNEELCALAQAGSGHAMDVLIWRNEAFLAERARKVWNIAFKNTQEYSVDLDDLMQAAREGMWRAIIAFKPSYGTKLLTLAGICIENKLADLEREYFSDIKEEKNGFRVEEDKQEEEEPPYINQRLRPDEYKKRPEPMALARETSEEICRSVNSLEPRERKYLCYRFGYPFDDEVPQRKAAEHFLITRTRADELEQEALQHFRVGLHWDTLDYWIDVEHDQE
jgi:RNA polymerase primary sigma factor/RNA polymerase sporulation-specific sigma factor